MSNNSKKILIIEDETPVRNIMVDALQNVNEWIILQAKDGQEGLGMALKEHPDLILLDLMMPKMSGQQVCEALRGDDWGKNARIIILTNLDSKTEQDGLKTFNVEDYIVKANIKLDDIVTKVKDILKD